MTDPQLVARTFEWDGMPGHVLVETMTLEDLGDGRTKVVATSLFLTAEERDGMLKSGMEQGLNQTYVALDRVLAEEDAPKSKVTPFLMFNDQLEAAIEFYTATFPSSKVNHVSRADDGRVTSAEFVVGGQTFMAFNGGPHFSFSEGVSLFVSCQDQAEVDLYWGRLLKGGAKPSQCGWITDRFGLSWQIVPNRLTELLGDKNPKKVQAVVGTMMKMVKLEVAALEKAYAAAS